MPPLVRVHIKDTLRDVVGVRSEKLGWPLRAAMRRVAERAVRRGRDPAPGGDARGTSWTASGSWTRSPRQPRQRGATVLRTYGIGAQILKDLGLKRMRVLSAPKQLQGLAAFDLEVTEYIDGGE